jgi:hypothetical protein
VISRRTGVAFFLALLIGIALLAWSGSKDEQTRAFSLELPFDHPRATLPAGRQACEGPIESQMAFGAVRAFALPAGSPAALGIIVSDANTGRVIAHGQTPAAVGFSAVTATLNAPVPPSRRVTVCLIGRGPGRMVLGGSSAAGNPVRLRVEGRSVPGGVSLVMLEARRQSFISLLPTIINRATLFRPGWVGAWTFWTLALALVGAALALGVAVAHAAVDEESRGQKAPSLPAGQE